MLQRVLVAQLGARMHYAIPRILEEAGVLERLYTDICAVKGWPRLFNLVPSSMQPRVLQRLVGRVPHGVPVEKIEAFTQLGLRYWHARRKAMGIEQANGVHIAFGRAFCKAVARRNWGGATTIYTFNSAGLELLQAASKAGLKTVMEQTIAPQAIEREILAKAAERYPDWLGDLGTGPNTDMFIRREEEEWQLADTILCGSQFVIDGIAQRGGPVNRCKLVHYGVDNRFALNHSTRKAGPLRVLTVGEIGLRKGSPVLWEVARLVGSNVQFQMVGGLRAPQAVLRMKPDNVELVGIVPRDQVIDHYRWADVFLLPSLCEGSATVIYEAIMAGLPVICTPNSGSIIKNMVNGVIVPPMSPESIVGALELWLEDTKIPLFNSNSDGCNGQEASIDEYKKRLLAILST